MKKITLKELNANGQLICSFKEVACVNNNSIRPILYNSNDPTTCYLHYYNNEYYVTHHVYNTRQNVFNNFEVALKRFRDLVVELS